MGDRREAVPDPDSRSEIIVNGEGIFSLFFQRRELHGKAVHRLRSPAHTFRFSISCPLHRSSLVFILSGALHAQFLPVVQKGISGHQEIESAGKFGPAAVVVGVIAGAAGHIMICIEWRVDILRVCCSEELFLPDQCFSICGRRAAPPHDIGDQAVLSRKSKVKQGIHSALIIPGIDVLVFPCLADKVGIRTDLLDRCVEPPQELHILLMHICVVAGDGVQPESVHALFQPERGNFPDLFPHCLLVKVQIRHSFPEAALVVPS